MRWGARLAALGLVAALVACAPPARRPPATVLGIGDSVMLGGTGALQAAIPGMAVDAVVSRQYSTLPTVVAAHARAGTLPATIVIHLGTNGTIVPATCDGVVRMLGKRRVVMVTLTVPRTWQDANNVTIRACAARNHAALADWHAVSAGHPELLASDGYHLRAAGARVYASLIAAALKAP
jgi:lysophospholipase L1-like esterase